jgi:hypothetical protein
MYKWRRIYLTHAVIEAAYEDPQLPFPMYEQELLFGTNES